MLCFESGDSIRRIMPLYSIFMHDSVRTWNYMRARADAAGSPLSILKHIFICIFILDLNMEGRREVLYAHFDSRYAHGIFQVLAILNKYDLLKVIKAAWC